MAKWSGIVQNTTEQNRLQKNTIKQNRTEQNRTDYIWAGTIASTNLDHIQSPVQPFAYAISSPLLKKMSAKSPGCKN